MGGVVESYDWRADPATHSGHHATPYCLAIAVPVGGATYEIHNPVNKAMQAP